MHITMKRFACVFALVGVVVLQETRAFSAPPSHSPSFLRHTSSRSTAALRAAEEDGLAPAGSSDDACPGYPRCSGEYRDKGCDGTGRISGGVGALIPWLPVKAYRPCPSFTEAKYKYTRQGQSLNEVVFARRRGTMSDITMDDSFGAMKEEVDEPAPGDLQEVNEGSESESKS